MDIIRRQTNLFSHKATQCGAVAIEAAFLLPIALVLLFAICHYSMIFFAASLFDHAAKEGIRSALSLVDESCYFSTSGCSDQATLDLVRPTIIASSSDVIQTMTKGSGDDLGSLFGVALPSKNQLISVSTISGGGCCEVSINFSNYRATPFLPTQVVDSLLPGTESVFPDAITASVVMKLN
ncbi:TadE family protein [Vibrio natriegens]|uniref:TadE family protein n=1 Tax=Vibrio natriegens TaxID=691 RepID=UPI0009C01D90|nr:TadE family protein [Vibrio natriegens]